MSESPIANVVISENDAESQQKIESKSQVFSRLRAHHVELRQLGVSKCGVFGSFVRGNSIHEDSDIDILVSFEPEKKAFDNFMALSLWRLVYGA